MQKGELSKWKFFEKQGNFEIIDLGRPAIFLIPADKLQKKIMSDVTAEKHLEMFLQRHFRAFTRTRSTMSGYWEGIVDELVEYEVSFLGKHNVPILLHELAYIARKIGEKYIYVKIGQYTALVRPKRAKNHYKKSPV